MIKHLSQLFSTYLYIELVYPKEENITDQYITIVCDYPFNGTTINVPKSNIINFEHRLDFNYSFLFSVKKQLFKKDLEITLTVVPPFSASEEEIDEFFKGIK